MGGKRDFVYVGVVGFVVKSLLKIFWLVLWGGWWFGVVGLWWGCDQNFLFRFLDIFAPPHLLEVVLASFLSNEVGVFVLWPGWVGLVLLPCFFGCLCLFSIVYLIGFIHGLYVIVGCGFGSIGVAASGWRCFRKD